MNKVELLAYRCDTMILLLINLYEKSEITEKEFIENTALKIKFLTDNLNKIKDTKIKDLSKQVLTHYYKVLNDRGTNELVYNTQV